MDDERLSLFFIFYYFGEMSVRVVQLGCKGVRGVLRCCLVLCVSKSNHVFTLFDGGEEGEDNGGGTPTMTLFFGEACSGAMVRPRTV